MNEPIDILKLHPIRKTKAQKENFRSDVLAYVKEQGYEPQIETEKMGIRNVVIGDPDKAKYLVTAHYDTPMTNMTKKFGMLIGVGIGIGLRILMPEECRGAVRTMIFFMVYLAFYVAFRFQLLPANKNNANDNTSGVVTVLEILRTLPKNHRYKVCFVLFDQEEGGLKGSSAYRKSHKTATETQLILNLDCVGDGEHILLMPNKKARLDEKLIERLKSLDGWFENKQILTDDKGDCNTYSDHKNFPYAVAIGAYHKRKGNSYVVYNIHTKHDVILDMTNVDLLRVTLTTFVCGDAVK